MPRVDGITATRLLRARPRPPNDVLTTFDADENVLRALPPAPAASFQRSPPARITEGIPTVSPPATRSSPRHHSTTHGLPPAKGQPNQARARLQPLSPREHEVVLAIAQGLTNAEIADKLAMSVASVKAHITHILTKLGLTNRTQIALVGHDAGVA